MRGTLWIEKSTFQWVRVEAEVFRPVSIEGFLAQVQPGTRFLLDQAPVSGNLWLPIHYGMKARARVLFFFSKNSDEDETYYGYATAEESGMYGDQSAATAAGEGGAPSFWLYLQRYVGAESCQSSGAQRYLRRKMLSASPLRMHAKPRTASLRKSPFPHTTVAAHLTIVLPAMPKTRARAASSVGIP